MGRRSTTTYYPIPSRSKITLRRATTTSLDENNISELKRDIFKLSLYNRNTEPIKEIRENVVHISTGRSPREHNPNDEAYRNPEIVDNHNNVLDLSMNTANSDEDDAIEQSTICISDITEDCSIQKESSIVTKIETNDQIDCDSTFISDNTFEQDEKAEDIPFNDEHTATSTESTDPANADIYPTTSKGVGPITNSYVNIHKPLKELIHQTNRRLYDVDSRKVQYRAGLSKYVTGIPSLHPNKRNPNRPV